MPYETMRAAFKAAMVAAGHHEPDLSDFGSSRDSDRFFGWKLAISSGHACQFGLDHGGNIYRRYVDPQCRDSRASAAPGGEPVAVVESATLGAGGFHARLQPGQKMPTRGEPLYLAPPSDAGQRAGWPEVDSYVFPRTPLQANGVWVKRARQLAGPDLWKVTNGLDDCLNVHGQWEFEPSPSSRDEEFLARCRFPTAEAAIRAAISESEGSSNA